MTTITPFLTWHAEPSERHLNETYSPLFPGDRDCTVSVHIMPRERGEEHLLWGAALRAETFLAEHVARVETITPEDRPLVALKAHRYGFSLDRYETLRAFARRLEEQFPGLHITLTVDTYLEPEDKNLR